MTPELAASIFAFSSSKKGIARSNDHEEAVSGATDFHILDAGVADRLDHFREDVIGLVPALIFRDQFALVDEVNRLCHRMLPPRVRKGRSGRHR